jgi:hypothetical protein
MKIYIIVTTSLNNKYGIIDETHRRIRYIECINHLLYLLTNDNYIHLIVVENNGKRNTYLDHLGCDIVYTNNNNVISVHKGVNELLDIKHVIKIYNIQDNDIVIKLTGRYKLFSLDFIELVKQNYEKYDAFVKCFNVCTLKYNKNDSVLGLFAIKCKYLKEFNYKCRKSPECEFIDYLNDVVKERINDVKVLNLECCFADDLRKLIV